MTWYNQIATCIVCIKGLESLSVRCKICVSEWISARGDLHKTTKRFWSQGTIGEGLLVEEGFIWP
jgi:hypothetical protein